MSESEIESATAAIEELPDQVARLQKHVGDLEVENHRKDKRIAELEDQVDERDERVAELEERVDDLEARGEAATRKRHHLSDEIERVEKKAETDEVDRALHDADEAEAQAETKAPRTPLEQVVGLPEPLASEELTANQERARFIAQDVRDYAERVPAGFAIPSTDFRKVLKAKDGSTPHTQTVARVMDFLDELGGEDVTLVERRGTKRIAFSEEAAERLATFASRASMQADAEAGPDPSGTITPVVMGGG